MTETATSLFLHTPFSVPHSGRDTRMAYASASLLRSTGCHEPVTGRLFERSLPGVDVFPDGAVFPKATLARLPGVHVYRLRQAFSPPQVEVVVCQPNRIVEILQLGYEAFKRSRPLPPHLREAAQMILRCRTSALGGHIEECPDGHIARIHYNSCGHQFCPRCGYRKRQQWIAQQREKLLPVRHFHVTFTIPHAFNDLWWCNFKDIATLGGQKLADAPDIRQIWSHGMVQQGRSRQPSAPLLPSNPVLSATCGGGDRVCTRLDGGLMLLISEDRRWQEHCSVCKLSNREETHSQ